MRTAFLVFVAAVTVLGGSAVAQAAWGTPSADLRFTVRAGDLPGGPTPVLATSSAGVRISWVPARLPNVTYRVSRLVDGGRREPVCVTDTSSCLDGKAVGGGSYTYTIRLIMSTWQGAESATRTAVVKAAPTVEPSPTASEPPTKAAEALNPTKTPDTPEPTEAAENPQSTESQESSEAQVTNG